MGSHGILQGRSARILYGLGLRALGHTCPSTSGLVSSYLNRRFGAEPRVGFMGLGEVYALTTRTSQARFMVRGRRDTSGEV